MREPSLAASFLAAGFFAVARRGRRLAPFRRAARITSAVLPAVAMLFTEAWTEIDAVFVLGATGAAYVAVARLIGTRSAPILGALAFDGAVLVGWAQAGITDPQLYALPVGASLLLLGHVHRAELSARATATIRMIALTLVYLASAFSILRFADPSHNLVMAAICVGGMLVGVLSRIRSYLILGAGFLSIDLITDLVRFGLSGQTAATVVLTGLGLALLSGMVVWTSHRNKIRRAVDRLSLEVIAWPL